MFHVWYIYGIYLPVGTFCKCMFVKMLYMESLGDGRCLSFHTHMQHFWCVGTPVFSKTISCGQGGIGIQQWINTKYPQKFGIANPGLIIPGSLVGGTLRNEGFGCGTDGSSFIEV